ncbi:MAG: ATPase, partial [Candidatus Taylorbacteria bacterium]|nr:ATPase [Candidatus Taylorbacteria bacterium]
MTQKEALSILKTGKNAFITGPAGSGKTFVVNEYISYLREHDVPIGITASTGIAATHMGGVTIHSWSGIGVRDDLSEYDIESIAEKSYIRKRIEETKVLIIDEVSMLHNFRLDLVERVVRYIKARKDPLNGELPFGGIQVVLCGDFFQLPPISRGGFRQESAKPERPSREVAMEAAPQSAIAFGEGTDGIQIVSEEYGAVSESDIYMGEFGEIEEEPEKPRTEFIYNADSWREGDFSICYLSENHRQKDDVSLTILNEIRAGVVSKESMAHLRSRHVEVLRTQPKDSAAAAAYIEPTRLFTHNLNVDSVNSDELDKVDAAEFIYEMRSKGRPMLVESLMKSCLAPQILRLRKGARIMCVKNNFDKGYVNGTLGTVVSCGPGVQPVILTAPTRDHPNGRTVAIEESSWKIEDEGKVLAEITQYPLRLAWAITVHKSQGMSLDAIEVDLSRSFEPGMGYVALS